jgi:hypothetical protein
MKQTKNESIAKTEEQRVVGEVPGRGPISHALYNIREDIKKGKAEG